MFQNVDQSRASSEFSRCRQDFKNNFWRVVGFNANTGQELLPNWLMVNVG